MPTFMQHTKQSPERAAESVTRTVVAREPKTLLQQIIIVTDSKHDLAWMDKLKEANFDPILMTSNFDAIQMLVENLELRMALFSQQSSMMDGIAACQLLRQSRSEQDVAIVLMLNENLDQAIVEAFAAGASDVVCHPFHTSELMARLDATRQRLLLFGTGEISSPGFQAEQAETRDEKVASQPRPHFGTSPRNANPDRGVADRPVVERGAVVSQPQSESPPRNATRLAGDWLLTHDLPHGLAGPVLDLSQLKFVPSLPAHQIESARQRGELHEVLLDRVWVCPQCRAVPTFRPACPCCGSAGVERERMMHHFACAFVGPTSEFQLNAEGLACPKCCTQRLMVGTDCEFLDGPWRCGDCDWSPAELEIVGHCLKCGFRFPAQQAVLEDLVGHHVDRLAPLADVAHTH